MTSPRISVIVPAYCTSRRHGTSRLELALASWARQTLRPDQYEIVVVDDGSDPPLYPQVNRWGLGDRVRVLRQENSGLAHAYNAGIAASRGDLVLFATDDELAGPTLLEAHVTTHDRVPNAMVFGECRTIFHSELFTDVTVPELVPDAMNRIPANPSDRWLREAVAATGLHRKPITRSDVENDFDKVLRWAGTLPTFADIERNLRRGHCHELEGGWLAVRVGNHSVSTKTMRSLGGFDLVLDEHDGWYLDIEVGLRLVTAGIRFELTDGAMSANLAHPRSPGLFMGALSGMAYLFGKHRRLDVALAPLYFQRELGLAEYARLLRGAQKWWPEDLGSPGGLTDADISRR
jgi:glycosyltransferase involved in cell wall biosynthesis